MIDSDQGSRHMFNCITHRDPHLNTSCSQGRRIGCVQWDLNEIVTVRSCLFTLQKRGRACRLQGLKRSETNPACPGSPYCVSVNANPFQSGQQFCSAQVAAKCSSTRPQPKKLSNAVDDCHCQCHG